mgnify:CR=1 FL=1
MQIISLSDYWFQKMIVSKLNLMVFIVDKLQLELST